MKKGMWIVFRKELKDMFRDKKTIIVGILLPLLIFPIMYGLMGKGMENTNKKVTENVKIAIEDKGTSALTNFIKMQKNFSIIESKDMKEDVKEGKIYVGIQVPADFDDLIVEDKQSTIKITYDDTSQNSSMAMGLVNSVVDAYTKQVINKRLTARGIDESLLNPVLIDESTVSKEPTNFGRVMLSMMLPLFLVMYSVSSPVAAATDLGAGEKERGTLEPLLTTKVGRMSLLFGKFYAITIMGLMGTISSIIGLLISFKVAPGMFGGEVSFVFPPKALLLIAVYTVLTTLIFGALELAISIYARSFKEAQTYLSPLTLVGMAGAFVTYMMDYKDISIVYFNIPVVNISAIIKEIVNGVYNPVHLGLTFAWTIVYIAASLLFARYMFSKEEVIFRT